MHALFLPLLFLIPSSSGLATVAMPIMAPLAGFADVAPSLVVTAYPSASGLMNLFIPTSRRPWAAWRSRGAVRALPAMGMAAAGRPGRSHGSRAGPRSRGVRIPARPG
jgi:hypothetical protein